MGDSKDSANGIFLSSLSHKIVHVYSMHGKIRCKQIDARQKKKKIGTQIGFPKRNDIRLNGKNE